MRARWRDSNPSREARPSGQHEPMKGVMRPFLLLCALLASIAIAGEAIADAPPQGAVAACQAEAQQLGADGFKAKYGSTEPYGHCYAAHATTVTTTTTTVTTSDP